MQIPSSIRLWALAVIYFAETVIIAATCFNVNYRLPNETYPENYNLELTTDVHLGIKAFQGEITIDIVVVKATSYIVLHSRQLEIFNVTIANPSTGESEELLSEYEPEREFLILKRKNDQLFAASTKWKLTIAFTGELRDDSTGFYLSKYTDDEGNYHHFAVTFFEPANARSAFPCYDEPDKRANFTIIINHSPTYMALSNMPVNEPLSSAGKTVFLTTPSIPTYVVAFAVSDFEYTEGVLNGVPQRVYSRPNAKNEHRWPLISAMLIEQYLSEYYGVKFMLPKMDHLAVPRSKFLAAENMGLSIYRENGLLYNERTESLTLQTKISNTIAHEMSHQWFGGYVSIKWWTYHWLKEGFASLFSYKALDHVHPEWDIWQDFHRKYYNYALSLDRSSSTPISTYVEKPEELENLFNYFHYTKSGSVLHMWNNALTEKVFQKGVRNFLTKNQFSSVGADELFTAFQTAIEEENYKMPATFREMLSSWIYQSDYPILTVTRDYDSGTFTVKQEAHERVNETKTWYVPINYAAGSDPDFRDTKATHYLLNVTETKFEDVNIAETDWLMLNKQSTGYYRINYDARNWDLIAESLIETPFRIHHRNRGQLIHDAYEFSITNRLDHAIFLKLLSYLKHEDQYTAWATVSSIFTKYDWYLRGDEKYDDFKFFVAEQVRPIYKKLGIISIPGENVYDKINRHTIIKLACTSDVSECLEESNNKLGAVLKDNIPLEPYLKYLIYCNGLRQSSDEVFNIYFEKLLNSTNLALRNDLIKSLGCTQNINQIKTIINSIIDESNDLRPQERYNLLRPVYARSQQGFMACIDFLNDNWDIYGNLKRDIGGSNPLNYDILQMASNVVNKNQENRLLDLVDKVKNSKHVTPSLERDVKKKIAHNFQWLKEHGEPIMSWVSQYVSQRKTELGGSSAV